MNIVRKSFPVGPLQCNCTVIGDTEAGIGYVFDPGGDARQLKRSIQQRIYCLDDSAVVVPGHGPETSIGREMRSNAFVRANS
jgi:glyoxylase-like metal-dependent hydrolase (beta-lactamase superfamily II)